MPHSPYTISMAITFEFENEQEATKAAHAMLDFVVKDIAHMTSASVTVDKMTESDISG